MRIRHGRLALATVVATTAVLVGAVPVAANAQTPSDSAGTASATQGMVRYGAQNPQATHIVVQGTRIDGGCQFTAAGEGSAAQASTTGAKQEAFQYAETAYDATTCQSYVDRTTAPISTASKATAANGVGGGATSNGKASAPPAAGTLAARCNNPYRDTSHGYSSDACIHTWFQDPPGIHVNDVNNEVQWNPGAGCATNGYSYASYAWSLLWQTGWWHTVEFWRPAFSCSGVTSNTTEIFENDLFCATTISGTAYDPSYITGFGNGSYSWSVSWRKVGLCQGLLSFHYSDET
jgi:hypothetical protein